MQDANFSIVLKLAPCRVQKGMGIIYNVVKNKYARIIIPVNFDRSSLHESHESDARHVEKYTISQEFFRIFTRQEKTRH
jgi:hypothetical protein